MSNPLSHNLGDGESREEKIKIFASELRRGTHSSGWSHDRIASDLTRFMGETVTADEVKAALGE